MSADSHKPDWQKTVGTFESGFEQIELVVRSGTGGEYWVLPEKGCVPRMKIGVEYNTFNEVIGVLLHETMEFQMTRLRCRWEPSHDIGRDHSSYHFHMDHPTYSDICSKVGEFIGHAYGPLRQAWLARKKAMAKKRK